MVIWSATPSGDFSAKSAWQAIKKVLPSVGWHVIVWFKGHVPRGNFIEWLVYMPQ